LLEATTRQAKRGLFGCGARGHGLTGPDPASSQETAMATDDKSRRVEVSDGDQTIAAAQVAEHTEETVRASLLPTSGHTPPGTRASLVDAVMDTPEVQGSSRVEATVPLGDTESLERLRERTDNAVTRPAGSTVLVDADIPEADDTDRG
jgi:uncharacterized phage protein gp47/JayE